MSAAATTPRTDDSLMRATRGGLAQPLCVVEREPVRHAGDELRDRRRLLSALDQVVEDPPHHAACPDVLGARGGREVDALEHERPEGEHRPADLLALCD